MTTLKSMEICPFTLSPDSSVYSGRSRAATNGAVNSKLLGTPFGMVCTVSIPTTTSLTARSGYSGRGFCVRTRTQRAAHFVRTPSIPNASDGGAGQTEMLKAQKLPQLPWRETTG